MKEFDLIEECLNIFPQRFKNLPDGPGDDSAILKSSSNSTVVSTDSLVENVHFKLSWSDPKEVAWKALAANDSDIASMGGETKGYLFSIGVPRGYSEVVKKLYQGFLEYFLYRETAFGLNTKILGGDTVSSATFFISITVLGSCQNPVTRFGAKPGDILLLSREVGYSSLGFEALSGDLKFNISPLDLETAIKAHKTPNSEIELGQYLGENNLCTSMIDISDGLIQDAIHICRRSSVSMNINTNYFSKYLKQVPNFVKMTSGEEYCLLFTLETEQKAKQLINKFPNVCSIGSIIEQKDEPLYLYGEEETLSLSQYLKINNKTIKEIGYQHSDL